MPETAIGVSMKPIMIALAPMPCRAFFCSRIAGMAALIVSHMPFTFTAMMRSKISSSSRSAGVSPPPPPLLTRMSSRP